MLKAAIAEILANGVDLVRVQMLEKRGAVLRLTRKDMDSTLQVGLCPEYPFKYQSQG